MSNEPTPSWHDEDDPDGFLLPEHDPQNYVSRLAHGASQRTQPDAGVVSFTIFARLHAFLAILWQRGER